MKHEADERVIVLKLDTDEEVLCQLMKGSVRIYSTFSLDARHSRTRHMIGCHRQRQWLGITLAVVLTQILEQKVEVAALVRCRSTVPCM